MSDHLNHGSETQNTAPPGPGKAPKRPGNRALRILGGLFIAAIALAVVAEIVISGIGPRVRAETALRTETDQMAIPTVAVIEPKHGAPTQEIVLPADIQAFTDAPIYARTSGYLKNWYVDIGAHVKQGQLLAEIDTPEIGHQVQQARDDRATAQANLDLADTTAKRYQDLLTTDSVSRQEVDNAVGNLQARRAAVQSAESNIKRLEELQSFQKIYAPFDGVVTARNTDIGALIDSGSSTPARELFHIASLDRVRVYVDMPQVYSRLAKPGLTADLTLAEFPNRRFAAKLVTTSGAIAESTRTLRVEFDASNPTGELLPGSYAEIHMKTPTEQSMYVLPVTALLFRSEGLRVAILKDNNHVALVPITIGRDFGNEVEIVAGINGSEKVVDSPPDSLVADQVVRIAQSNKEKP